MSPTRSSPSIREARLEAQAGAPRSELRPLKKKHNPKDYILTAGGRVGRVYGELYEMDEEHVWKVGALSILLANGYSPRLGRPRLHATSRSPKSSDLHLSSCKTWKQREN